MSPQNSVALASIQLPPSLFSSLPAALTPPVPPDCTLQLLVFRNGRLFRSHGNTSRPGAAGPGKRRGVATPVIFAGTSKGLHPTPNHSTTGIPQTVCPAPPSHPSLTRTPDALVKVAGDGGPTPFLRTRGTKVSHKGRDCREMAQETLDFISWVCQMSKGL